MLPNVGDVAAVICISARRPNTDDITGGCNVAAGESAQGCVGVASACEKRFKTDGRIVGARCVVNEGVAANGRIGDASVVVLERLTTDGGIEEPIDIIKKRLVTGGRVPTACGVARERSRTYCSV